MQVIYHMIDGIYPFHHPQPSDKAYVEYLVSTSEEAGMVRYRELARTFKTINCPYLIKIAKMHFMYQFVNCSLENYLTKSTSVELKKILSELSCVLQCLHEVKFKAELRFENMGVDEHGHLKLFISPQIEISSESSELQQFYNTQKTRLRIEIEEVYESSEKIKQNGQSNVQKPNFIISGNQLIFLKGRGNRQEENIAISSKCSSQTPSELTNSNKQTASSNLSKNIPLIKQIQKQKQRSQQIKNKRPNSHIDGDEKSSKMNKYSSPSSKDNPLNDKNILKMFGDIEDTTTNRRQSLRNSTGGPKCEDKQIGGKINSKLEERPYSSMRGEERESFKSGLRSIQNRIQERQRQTAKLPQKNEQFRKQSFLQQGNSNSPQNQIAVPNQQARIQITTEMVSKYKMKIVTCQEIQFEGKEGDDIQKLAQQKLLEYQSQYSMPQAAFNQFHNSRQNQSQDFDGQLQKTQSTKNESQGKNQEIMTKIMRAKEKASTALKQYAKNKKK